MSKLGCKKMNLSLKRTLVRTTVRKTKERPTAGTILEMYGELVSSFTKQDFTDYEKLHRSWGTPGRKKHIMLEIALRNKMSEPVCALAKIRAEDLMHHQKILQVLRNRWLNLVEHKKNIVNNNPELFWLGMANKLSRVSKERKGIKISSAWTEVESRGELVTFLKELYEKQDGKCAITGVTLELEIGTKKPKPNKCSLDRIDSNRGYYKSNVWFVAWWVNAMKSDMTMDTFQDRIRILNSSLTENKSTT